uniref:Cobalamin-binding protein n=1 Tax=Ignisphaera aggregans TaxID=334771 RepID=A0A7C2V9V5_9CREN
MSVDEILAKIRDSLANLDLDGTIKYVEEALNKGIDVVTVIEKGLSEGMKIVGERYERGEYFVADMIMAAEIFNEVMGILKPRILESKGEIKHVGRVVIGTVYGDIHDIGKNLVIAILEANGFEVIDLGVDVPVEKFVEAVRQYKPEILGMSALLTSTMVHMKDVIDALKREGLRDKIKVIVGGAPLTEEFAKSIGADAYAENAFKAAEVCKRLVEGLRK